MGLAGVLGLSPKRDKAKSTGPSISVANSAATEGAKKQAKGAGKKAATIVIQASQPLAILVLTICTDLTSFSHDYLP